MPEATYIGDYNEIRGYSANEQMCLDGFIYQANVAVPPNCPPMDTGKSDYYWSFVGPAGVASSSPVVNKVMRYDYAHGVDCTVEFGAVDKFGSSGLKTVAATDGYLALYCNVATGTSSGTYRIFVNNMYIQNGYRAASTIATLMAGCFVRKGDEVLLSYTGAGGFANTSAAVVFPLLFDEPE